MLTLANVVQTSGTQEAMASSLRCPCRIPLDACPGPGQLCWRDPGGQDQQQGGNVPFLLEFLRIFVGFALGDFGFEFGVGSFILALDFRKLYVTWIIYIAHHTSILWVVPLPGNSHHQDYCIFSR